MTADQQESLISFASSLEQAIGTQNTQSLLTNVGNFAKECPDILQELTKFVYENPETAGKLLTREGVNELKGVIEVVSSNTSLFGDIF